MTFKLDLVPFFINRSKQIQSKWLALSRSDMILLAGYELHAKEYKVTYRHDSSDELVELYTNYVAPSINLEVFVEIVR